MSDAGSDDHNEGGVVKGAADATCPSCSRSLAGVKAESDELVCPDCGTGFLTLLSEQDPDVEPEEEPEDDLPPSSFTFAIFDRSSGEYAPEEPEWPVFFIGSPEAPDLGGADRVAMYPWMDARRFRWLECLEGSHFQYCQVRRGKKMADPLTPEEQQEAYAELRRRLLELGLKEAPEKIIRAQEKETGYTAVRAQGAGAAAASSGKAEAETGKPAKAHGRLAGKTSEGPARKKRDTAEEEEEEDGDGDEEEDKEADGEEEGMAAAASSAPKNTKKPTARTRARK